MYILHRFRDIDLIAENLDFYTPLSFIASVRGVVGILKRRLFVRKLDGAIWAWMHLEDTGWRKKHPELCVTKLCA